MKKRVLVFICIFLVTGVLLSGCWNHSFTEPEIFGFGDFRRLSSFRRVDPVAVAVFDETYNHDRPIFETLTDGMRSYSMSLILGTSEVKLQLRSEDGSWIGTLRHIEHDVSIQTSEELNTRSFDAKIVDDFLIVFSEPQREIPVAGFFANQFDPGLFTMNRAGYGDFGMSGTAIVAGIYDAEAARRFMEWFYENFISIFPSFDQSERYFRNIDRLFYASFQGWPDGVPIFRLFFNDDSEVKAYSGQQRKVAEMIFTEVVYPFF